MARFLPRTAFLLVTLLIGMSFSPFAAARPAAGGAQIYQEDFQDGEAQGWSLESGWRLVQDKAAWFLEGSGHAWARSGVTLGDSFRLILRVRLVLGRVHLVVRNNDVGRYFIGVDSSGSDLNRQEWPSTFHNGLATSSRNHAPNTWHTVEVIGEGAGLRVLVDGNEELRYTDPSPLLGGTFAVEALDGSLVQVDDVALYDLAAGAIATSVTSTSAPLSSPTATRPAREDPSWVRLGGPLGGLGYDVRMRPDNPDLMLVTDALAGVFRSQDGGQTWEPTNSGITTRTGETGDAIPVFSLTIDPSDPNIVWAGTQFLRGIFKSVDGGRTWKSMVAGVVEREGITFRGFGVDPHNSLVVYAAAELSSWAWNPGPRPGREFDMVKGVVYKTTDGGQSWRAVWRGDNLARYVLIDPRDTNVVYVSTGIFDREAANSDPQQRIPGGVGVLKSTNAGTSWTPMTQGLGNLYVGTLFMNPEDPDMLLAGAGNIQYEQGAGVYLTTDGGQSWKRTLADDIIEAVEFAASDPSIAYAGSNGRVFRSDDSGVHWQIVSGTNEGWGPSGVRAGFPIDFQVDPRNPLRIFTNNYGGGNFLSVDGGATWTTASRGYTGAQVRGIAIDPLNPAHVYAAARSGLFASEDGGSQWVGLSRPPVYSLEWMVVTVDPSEPAHMLASNNWNRTVLESRDAGHRWSLTRASLPEGSRAGWRAFAFAPSATQTVYAGTAGSYSAGSFDPQLPGRGIWVSHDGGESWSKSPEPVWGDAHVADLAVDPVTAERAFAATLNHGLLRSEDAGTTWQEVTRSVANKVEMLSVEVDPSDPLRVFAGRRRGGLMLSEDGGTSWKRVAAGLNPEANVTSIVFDPHHPSTMYLADSSSGVYRSMDGGARWQPVSSGLLNRAVNGLAVSGDGLHLYAATEGGGVFRLDINGEPPQPVEAAAATTSPASSAEAEPSQVLMATESAASQVPPAPSGANPGLCASASLVPLALVAWAQRRRRDTR